MTSPSWTAAAPVMGMHPAVAAKEILDRREARGSFLGYARYMQPDNEQPALHHELICNTLDQVEKGEIDRVMLFLPPGAAKSTYGSVLFPQYFLGRNPQLTVICGSHTQDLANRFSRRTRNGINQQRFADLFPQCRLASDSASVLSWETTQGGEYKPVGVGGNITGRRGDCLLGNTMVKTYNGDVAIAAVKVGDHVLAQHENRTVYRRVAAVMRREATEYLRIHTTSGRVVEATGNHRIRVGAVWKEASSIVVGDVLLCLLRDGVEPIGVRAGEEGQVRAAGSACVQQLVRDAAEQCSPRDAAGADVQQLQQGNVRRSAEGEGMLGCLQSGYREEARAEEPHGARARVRHMRQEVSTNNNNVRVEDLLHDVQEQTALHGYEGREQPRLGRWRDAAKGEGLGAKGVQAREATCVEGGLRNVRGVRVGGAAARTSHQPQPTGQLVRESCDDVQRLSRCLPCCGEEQTQVEFVSVVERVRCGEGVGVYDIEVEEAHNFFANGVLVHNCVIIDDPTKSREDADSDTKRDTVWQWWLNDVKTRLKPGGRCVLIQTRWHEDDLAGRLLEMEKGRWVVIKVPMIAGRADPIGRAEGERLWPDWFTEQMVLDAQADSRSWTSLYQQDPRPPEGAEFKRSWINRYEHWPARSNKIILVDPSGGRDATSDFTSMWVLALGRDHNVYVVDGVRARLNLTARADKLFELHQKWRPVQTRYEHYGMQGDIEHIKSQMEIRDYRFKIFEVGGAVQKEARIRRLIPWFESGRIWFPKAGLMRNVAPGVEEDIVKNFIEQEYAAFPVGKFDDSFDNLARLAEPSMTLPWPKAQDDNESAASVLFGVMDEIAGY